MRRVRWPYTALFPELAYFDNEAQKQFMLNQAMRILIKSWRCWLFSGLVFLVYSGGLAIAERTLNVPGVVSSAIMGGLSGGTVVIGVAWIGRREIQRFLRRQLIDRLVPICLECGYNLRAQTVPRCPECGTPMDPVLVGTLPRAE